MNKKYIIIGIIIVAIVIIIIALSGGSNDATSPTSPVSSAPNMQVADSPQQIVNDLNGLDTGDINKEFQDIDSQIKGL